MNWIGPYTIDELLNAFYRLLMLDRLNVTDIIRREV